MLCFAHSLLSFAHLPCQEMRPTRGKGRPQWEEQMGSKWVVQNCNEHNGSHVVSALWRATKIMCRREKTVLLFVSSTQGVPWEQLTLHMDEDEILLYCYDSGSEILSLHSKGVFHKFVSKKLPSSSFPEQTVSVFLLFCLEWEKFQFSKDWWESLWTLSRRQAFWIWTLSGRLTFWFWTSGTGELMVFAYCTGTAINDMPGFSLPLSKSSCSLKSWALLHFILHSTCKIKIRSKILVLADNSWLRAFLFHFIPIRLARYLDDNTWLVLQFHFILIRFARKK